MMSTSVRHYPYLCGEYYVLINSDVIFSAIVIIVFVKFLNLLRDVFIELMHRLFTNESSPPKFIFLIEIDTAKGVF